MVKKILILRKSKNPRNNHRLMLYYFLFELSYIILNVIQTII